MLHPDIKAIAKANVKIEMPMELKNTPAVQNTHLHEDVHLQSCLLRSLWLDRELGDNDGTLGPFLVEGCTDCMCIDLYSCAYTLVFLPTLNACRL